MAVTFQLGIDNASPTITYYPSFPNVVAQDATSGWTPYYTISGFPSDPGQVGEGTSFQISSKNPSFFSITWFGSGIDLYGNATRATFQVGLNRKSGGKTSGDVLVGPSSDLLASFSNLPLDTYTVTLTANTSSSPSSFIAFERAVITGAVEVTNLDNLTVQSETVDDASIVYEGLWSTFQSSAIAPNRRFHVTDQFGDSAQLTFNGTAVSVYGLRDIIAGCYNVTLDGETTQYNAQSVWEEGTVLFYSTGLDPQRSHSLIITNAGDDILAIGYINTTSVTGVSIQTSRIRISKGAIAGIVVGIFLGVIVFPLLAFVLWRHRRRNRNFTFIEPSIHKRRDITEVLDIRPATLGQRRKPSMQSSISEVSLDLFPVTIPQVTSTRSRTSPPTFPRSPTTSLPSPAKQSPDDSGRDVRSPEAKTQGPSVHVQSPSTIDSENAPFLNFNNRRGTIPKPSGPRPQSHRTVSGDPRTSVFTSLAQIVAEPGPIQDKQPPELSEPKIEQVNEEAETTTYSFLDMTTASGPSSIMEGPRKSQNPIQPLSHTNLDSLPQLPPINRISSVPSHLDPDTRRESGTSRQLSLSAVIRPLPPLKLRQSPEFHPYHPPGYLQRPRSHRPSTGGASPTESLPATMSEVSEIRFCSANESSGSNASLQRAGSDPHSPSLKLAAMTSPIYQKLFGTHQGEIPPDDLLAKKRPLRRKQLSTSTFNTPPRT